MLTAIENAKKLVKDPAWPRPIHSFPKDSNFNCWGFALDSMKIPALQKLHWLSDLSKLDKEIFDFLHDVDLSPRKISAVEEKTSEEMIFLFYIFEYRYSNMRTSRSECHVARIELDGTVVEKADNSKEPVITSLEEIKQRLFNEFEVSVEPIMFAVQKPQ